MRLLRIETENLNSLYGANTVDLEEDLADAALFVIVGPTGAGKSTLMDAVSLALFSETPRLSALRSRGGAADDTDPRHIMSRGTGSCLARVVFSKLAPDGERVRYRATWACRRAGDRPDRALQTPTRSLERFDTGDGSWELLVDDHRKKVVEPVFSTVLEDMRVSEFQRSVLLAQGAFTALLAADPDAKAVILERLTNTEIYVRLGRRASQQHREAAQALATLEARLAEVALLDDDAVAALDDARAAAAELTAATRDALAAATAAHSWLRDEQQAAGALTAATDAVDAGVAALEAERDSWQRLDQDEAARPAASALEEVARLRAERVAIDQMLVALEERADDLSRKLAIADADVATSQAKVAQAEERRERESRALEAARLLHDVAARADAQAVAAEARRDALAEEHLALEAAHSAAHQASIAAAQQVERAAEAVAAFGEANALGTALSGLEARGRGVRERLQAAQALHERRTALRQRRETLALRSTARVEAAAAALQQAQEDATATAQALEQALAALLVAAERRDAARAEDAAARSVVDLADARATLADDEPCPLCGSPDHPWAGADVDDAAARRAADGANALAEAQRLHTRAADAVRDAQRAETIAETKLTAAQAAVDALGPIDRAGDDDALAAVDDELVAVERAIADEGAALDERSAGLIDDLRRYGVEASADDLDAALSAAVRRVADVDAARAAQAQAISERATLDAARQEALADVVAARGLWEAASEQAAEQRVEADRALTDARAHLGGRDPVVLEAALADALAAEVEHLEEAERVRQRLRDGRAECVGERAAATARREALASALATADADLKDHLTRLGLPDAEALEGQLLSADERDVLSARRDALTRALADARARHEVLAARAAVLAETRPLGVDLGVSLDALAAAEASAREAYEAANQQLGAIQEQLAQQSAARARYRDVKREWDAQRREATLWQRLHRLIGEGDGRKFQTFAQTLSLMELVERANVHLARLSERYRLAAATDRDGHARLDFAIIDRFQADRQRPITTLSGGETFLASLALALGLADMRRTGMPIETLLLDEGFGTLDPQSLDVALEALTQLHATTRIRVGIISHVDALRERIEARVVVEPVGNGRSRVRTELGPAEPASAAPVPTPGVTHTA